MRSAALLLVLLLVPAARAHEVVLQVERGRAVAARAVGTDGKPLAGAAYQVWSPAEPGTAWQEGKTDRDGWLSFVPATAGRWRVKVIEVEGHGLDSTVEVTAGAVARPAAGPSSPGTLGFVLRPLAALAVIALVFGGLMALRRKQRAP